jgi:NADPH-dependent 2,4-dienoyl-CoA reductase/sulfur reductase-like enzyme
MSFWFVRKRKGLFMKITRAKSILIIGGGIGGMTLASALHKLGIEAHVYEQAPALTEVGAGVGLWTNALFSLDQVGAGVPGGIRTLVCAVKGRIGHVCSVCMS